MKVSVSLGWHGSPGCVPDSNSDPTGHMEPVGGRMDASSHEEVAVALDRIHAPVGRITSMSQTRIMMGMR